MVYVVPIDLPAGVLLKDIRGSIVFTKAIRTPAVTQVFTRKEGSGRFLLVLTILGCNFYDSPKLPPTARRFAMSIFGNWMQPKQDHNISEEERL